MPFREKETTIETAQEKIEDLDRLTARAQRETEENQTRLQQEQEAVDASGRHAGSAARTDREQRQTSARKRRKASRAQAIL